MKGFFLVCCIFVSSAVNAQTMAEANRYFDNYEYLRAFRVYYRLKNDKNKFSSEDMKRFAYAGYAVGEYEKIEDIIDQIIQIDNVEPFFLYVHGEVCMSTGRYTEAKASYEKYATLDNEFDVSIKIESCDLIPEWTAMTFIQNQPVEDNTSKSDITGQILEDYVLRFHEVGMDSLGEGIGSDEIDYSELVINKPYLEDNNGNLHPLIMNDSLRFSSITSLVLIPGKNEAILTIAEPLKEGTVRMAPHLYSGSWDASTLSLSNVRPWIYSGFSDSLSTAHATIDESGQRIVFTGMKEGFETSDLYISYLKAGNWSVPKEMKELNTSGNEIFPVFQGDSILTFSTDGKPGYGKLDIYAYHFNNNFIEHLKSPVNSNMDDFSLYYFEGGDAAMYTSNRIGGAGDDDRYFIRLREKVVPEPVVTVDSSDFHNFVDKWIDQKIYFKFDKFNLNNDVEILNELIAFLEDNSASKITLEAHTDRRGTDGYNMELSRKRAESVKAELQRRGIKGDQIEIEALGESDPLVDCGECTEKMHAENRVVLLKLSAQ